jgi:L-threonylcarbamoyladenylate synthase
VFALGWDGRTSRAGSFQITHPSLDRSFVIVGPEDLDRCADLLRAGGLVAFPTETVYGLGANALDEVAVARVFEAKGRPRFDPLIVHVARWDDALPFVRDVSDGTRRLAERFWPGPLTLLLPKTDRIPDLVTAGLGEVGVRVPDHPLAQKLLERAGVPVAAPSANPFGRISPTTARHVADQLEDRVDAILDGGPCRVGVESTVVRHGSHGIEVLRLGGVTIEELEATGEPVRVSLSHAATPEAQAAPGNLLAHYAPRVPLRLHGAFAPALAPETSLAERRGPVGWLAFREAPLASSEDVVEILSANGDLREAASRVFAALRRLDASGVVRIEAERAPEIGLGRAINDRLFRAAAGSGHAGV